MTSVPPTIEYEYQRLRRFWMAMLSTPIIYLLAAWLLDNVGWIDARPSAPHPWDLPAVRTALAAVAGGSAAGAVWLRLRTRRAIVRCRGDAPLALRTWLRHFYAVAMMADSLAFLGLIYYAVSGRPWTLLAGGAATYVGYALLYPRRADLEPFKPGV